MAENPVVPPVERGLIEDKAPKPPGVMSKHTQSLVIMAVAVLMVLIMWLTGNNKRPTAVASPTAALPSVSPTDAAKLQELKNTIQSEQFVTRRPIAPPDATQHTWLNPPGMFGSPTPANQSAYYAPPNAQFAGTMPPSANSEPYQQPTATVEDALKEEKKKRAYESLFASNVSGPTARASKCTRTPWALSKKRAAGDRKIQRRMEHQNSYGRRG